MNTEEVESSGKKEKDSKGSGKIGGPAGEH